MSRRKPRWRRPRSSAPVQHRVPNSEAPPSGEWTKEDIHKARLIAQDAILRMQGVDPIFGSGAYDDE